MGGCSWSGGFSTRFDDLGVVVVRGVMLCPARWRGMQARSQGGGGGGRPPSNAQKKGERKKENKVACMHVKLPPFNHFQSKNKYKFVLYVENTGHMHQIAPLTTSKCKKLSLWEGGHPPPTPSLPPPPPSLAPLARAPSLRSLARYFYRPPLKIKSWLRHWGNGCWSEKSPKRSTVSFSGPPGI